MEKPIICVDFDGVIHSYENGWQNGHIYGTVVPGFFEWVESVKDEFKIVVYSSRSADPELKNRMITWLYIRYMEWTGDIKYIPNINIVDMNIDDFNTNIVIVKADIDKFNAIFSFSDTKPAAFITIDDRALRFNGDWAAPKFTPQALKEFKPWTQNNAV